LTGTHRQLVAVLRRQHTAAISTSGGYIVLNTVPLINQAPGKVSGLASDLAGKPVTLPTITRGPKALPGRETLLVPEVSLAETLIGGAG
jgi:hypothetical protein